MTKAYVIARLLIATRTALASNEPQFSIKESHQDSNGVTFRTASGTMRIEACGDRIIHVVTSQTAEIPAPKVPVAIRPCRANDLVVKIGKADVSLSTAAISVTADARTGAMSFRARNGKTVLAEPKDGGKAFDVPAHFETKTWQVQQTFVSPAGEFQYGLGQRQEGLFNVRGVPIRLHQANTNIAVPFLLSRQGYGVLWNHLWLLRTPCDGRSRSLVRHL